MIRKFFTGVMLTILVMAAIGMLFGSNKPTEQSRNETLSAMPPALAAEELTARAEANRIPMPDAKTYKASEHAAPGAWRYTQSKDEMRGTVTRFATLPAITEHSFAFPYSGGSKLVITLRRTGNADEVLLSVTKGQFTSCISHCTISARFDDGKVLTYTGSAAADGSHDVIFINEVSGFVRRIGQAKTLILEPEFFREGRRQFTFNVGGLRWP